MPNINSSFQFYDDLFIQLNLNCFRTGGKGLLDSHRSSTLAISDPLAETSTNPLIEPYIQAITGASGINRYQAKTCLYYTVSTYLIPEQLQIIPILAIIGALGTGKSRLLLQLKKMVKQPKLIGAESPATLRDELCNTVTALIDEGDSVHEPYLVRRYVKDTSQISYKTPIDERVWRNVVSDIFGGTIIVRRTPFKDQATKSRSIIIPTKYRPGNYDITDIDTEGIMKISNESIFTLESSQRVRDNWLPLQSIAMSLEDEE